MGKGLLVLALLVLATALGIGSAGADPPLSSDHCGDTGLYFNGSYYRALTLKHLRPRTANQVGAGTHVSCGSTAPVATPLRRLAGVRAGVALRDTANRHRLYVAGRLCMRRGGRTLLRCLHEASPEQWVFPPPAFAVVGDRYTSLDLFSYCWGVKRGHLGLATCADGPFPFRSPDTSGVPVEAGETLDFLLGFDPTEVSLDLYRSEFDFDHIELQAARMTSWRVPENLPLPTFFVLDARGAEGGAPYVGRFIGGGPASRRLITASPNSAARAPSTTRWSNVIET